MLGVRKRRRREFALCLQCDGGVGGDPHHPGHRVERAAPQQGEFERGRHQHGAAHDDALVRSQQARQPRSPESAVALAREIDR